MLVGSSVAIYNLFMHILVDVFNNLHCRVVGLFVCMFVFTVYVSGIV